MIVLDAGVLIAYLDGSDANHDSAVQLLEREVDQELRASPLSLAEVLVGPARAGRVDDAVAALRDLEIVEQPFPTDTAARLAQLRASTSLRMPDCCVLLAAQGAPARVASFDDALAKAAGGLGLDTVAS